MERVTAPAFTVVVICRNEAAYIEDCLASLEASVMAGEVSVEIVIVDGASQDATVELAKRWAERNCLDMSLRVLCLDSAGYARQRNAGVAAATASWVVFLSADVRVPADWARETKEALCVGHGLAIGRFALIPAAGKGSWMAPLVRTIYPSVTGFPSVERCSTVHLAASRALLWEHAFDERLLACEDKDVAYRATLVSGSCGVTALPVDVEHLARETFVGFLRKVYIESRELRIVAHQHGMAFPDCFGWRAHLRRTGIIVALTTIMVGAAHALAGQGCPAALAMIIPVLAVGGCHRTGWSRRPSADSILAVRHAFAMWAVVAGGANGAMKVASLCVRVRLGWPISLAPARLAAR